MSDGVRVAQACRRLLGCEDGVLQRFGSQRRTGSDEMRRQSRGGAYFRMVVVPRASAKRLQGTTDRGVQSCSACRRELSEDGLTEQIVGEVRTRIVDHHHPGARRLV